MTRIRPFLRVVISSSSLTLFCLLIFHSTTGPYYHKTVYIQRSPSNGRAAAGLSPRRDGHAPTDWDHPMTVDDLVSANKSSVTAVGVHSHVLGSTTTAAGRFNVSDVVSEKLQQPPCPNESVTSGRDLLILAWNTRKWFRMDGHVTVPPPTTTAASAAASTAHGGRRPGEVRCGDLRQVPAARTCTFTEDRRLYKVSSAVLILGDLASYPRDFPASYYHGRPAGQKWIYYSRESPGMNVYYGSRYSRLRRQVALYNLTSTYSMLSDIPHPYTDELCELPNNSSDAGSTPLDARTEAELQSIVSNKSAVVAWFVSHCQTASRRENYVRELSRYIAVDIYGKCATQQQQQQQGCPFSVHDAEPWANCDRTLLQRRYKFYLAFENSLCDDYVTEKFFRVARLDVVAVVLGSAAYERYGAAGTFVDVRQFDSPRRLADFLRRLDADDRLYVQFIRRKRRQICRRWSPFVDYRQRLCDYIHGHLSQTQTADIRRIIDPRLACTSPSNFYRNITGV